MSMEKGSSPSDAELVRLTLTGSRPAFGELVKRHQKLIAGVAKRYGASGVEAPDLVQDVFLHAYKAVSQLEQPERFAAWLYRLAVNRCVDLRRQGHARETATDGLAQRLSREPANPVLDEIRRTELRGIVRGAVDELSDELREVVYLRYYNELAYEEIADLLGVPLTTVDGRLRRAKGQLMQQLSRKTGL